MANATTKNIILSQSKAGQGDDNHVPTLNHCISRLDTCTEVQVEVPGVDPSSIEVFFENNYIAVRCKKGVFSMAIDPTVDTGKIRADVVWGMLTLTVPLPVAPVTRQIDVLIRDATPAKKPAARTHEHELVKK